MNEEHVAWYSLTYSSGLSARVVNGIWEAWNAISRYSAAELLEASEDDLPAGIGVKERRGLSAARDAIADAEKEIEACEAAGVSMITLADENYPESLRDTLGEACPPVLFVTGDLSLTQNPCAAIVGSRDATPEGLEFAALLGEGFAARCWTVVSGLAKGVDRTAMGAALEGGGSVTAVLPHGILARQKDLAGMREYIDGGRLVVISQFQPNAPWQVGLAMARNSVVIGLSKLVIVADAGETGGTREATRSAFKRGVPVWVREHDPEESPGLAALVRSGARVLEIDREAPAETLDRLVAEAAEAQPQPPAEEPKQGKLF